MGQESHEIEFEIFGEFLPNPQTRVELDPTVKDRHGLPAARITVQHHPADEEVNKIMVRRGMDMLKAIKPAPLEVNPWTWASTRAWLRRELAGDEIEDE